MIKVPKRLPHGVRAVVTGGGSGLGRALCLQLARRGGRILVADVRLDRAEATAAEVRAAGGVAEALACDVGRLEDMERAADGTERLWGGTDLLVNNAGVAVAGRVGEVPIADWEWILRVNLWGPIHGCHAFVPRMKAAGRGGWILNVASSAGIASLPEMGPYNVGKAGVISLSETLNAELAPFGIGVAALCPTFFKTHLTETMRSTEAQRALTERLFSLATLTADGVAAAALRGLEAGRPIVIPQLDGALLWRVKRLVPELYSWLLRKEEEHGLMRRLLEREEK